MRTATTLTLCLALTGCAADWDRPEAADRSQSGASDPVLEPVSFAEREGSAEYGIPVDGASSIADIIAILPSGGVDRELPNLWTAPDDQPSTDQCQGGMANVADNLPMVVEGVVTLTAAKYLKLPLCGQDERFYGAFVVEDDTGGILVLRDARIAEFAFGQRVRMTVRAVAQFYGDPTQRAVVAADIESLGSVTEPVLYEPTAESFKPDDAGLVRRIEGHVVVSPTSDNFNAMTLASAPLPAIPDGAGPATPVCTETCAGTCRRTCPSDNNALCADAICPALCADGATFDASAMPTACWNVAIEQELGRRGFTAPLGETLAITAPVTAGFGGLQMWVVRLGQIERR